VPARIPDYETLRLAMRGARLGSWTRDLRTEEVVWSPELEDLFGLEPGTFGRSRSSFLALVHEDDVDRLRAAVDRAIATGADYATEFRFRHSSGEWRWMDGRGRAEYDAAGTPLRLHGVGIDVTDRKRAEGARDRLAALVESAAAAVVGKQLDGIITSWNAGAVRLFGYTAEEMIGSPIFRIVPSELHDEEHEVLRRLRTGERIEDYETVRVARDGRRRHMRLAVSPVRNSQGEIVGASKIGICIDERRQAEERLREEAHALEILNRVGRAVAAELDMNKLVQLVTDAATELTGARFGAFFYNGHDAERGSYSLYALSGTDRSSFANFPMPRATAVFAPTFHAEGIVRSADIRKDPRYGHNAPHHGMPAGHLPVASYLAVPVVSRKGEALGGLFFGHENEGVFTERAERIAAGIAAQAAIGIDNARLYQERERLLESERAARSEAERLSHVKDEFLATLSHELRTPLNAIQGWAALLRQPQMGAADRERGLASIERNTRSQAQIINDLLDMSRIISGKLHLEVQPIDLREVIAAAIEAVAPAAEARGVAIDTALDEAAAAMRGDPNRLQQVMWNLLSNAVKFTPAGGRVRVALQRAAGQTRILVQDSGIGIRPEFLPHVFDRFRQADASTTRHYGGLGLGLSIVRNLVELHGGTVRAASGGENHGSSFIVSLPLPSAAAPPRQQRAGDRGAPLATHGEPVPLPRLDKVCILVVDDQKDTRELLEQIIAGSGGRTLGAAGAEQALRMLEDHPDIDLMISDIGMPGTDGYSLIRRLRERETASGRRALPAIAATAYARSEDREHALLAGYQLHLPKPVESRELIAAIASLLRIAAVG
jgi:PAS domain S-box-containing protein